MTNRVVHVLNLHAGDRFRYQLGGPVFELAVERDDQGRPVRYLARPVGGTPCPLAAIIGWEGCFVYPEIDQEDEES